MNNIHESFHQFSPETSRTFSLFVQCECWRACSPGSGVFAGYSQCYVSVGGGVSRPVSALYSLTFRSLESRLVEASCASARPSSFVCRNLRAADRVKLKPTECLSEWKVSTAAEKNPPATSLQEEE